MKTITYNNYTTLKNCKDEPINLLGSVQPFGCIIALENTSLNISHCSKNCDDFIPLTINEILNCKTKEFLELFANDELNLLTLKSIIRNNDTLTFECKELKKTCNVNVYNYKKHIFFELEALPNGYLNHNNYFKQTQYFIQRVNIASDFKTFSQFIAEDIQKITGFDRVMVYRFDANYNGEVFSEVKKKSLKPFLGLHFPHTDIPEQARLLYKKNHLRMLTNVNDPAIPIVTLNKENDYTSLDLGQSILRSISPIHTEYLKNMGVTATLSISIMIDEQLWGLIACHHYQPKHLGYYNRLAAKLQTDFFASQIKRWEQADSFNKAQEKEHIYQTIIENTKNHKNQFKAIASTSYITGLTASNGVAIIRDETIYLFGSTPTKMQIKDIQSWMKKNRKQSFLSAAFSKTYSKAQAFKKQASGILYYSLDNDTNSAIIWFRKELSDGKKWGGELELKNKTQRLTPRKSFEAWEEAVNGKSAEWNSYEIQAGLRLGAYLEREIYITNLTKQKKQYEILTNELKAKNEELSQFNWISSHDMKEPLRKIRLFIDQINTDEVLLNDTHKLYFQRIDAATERMQNLISDLLNYANLNNKATFKKIDFTTTVNEIAETFLETNNELTIQIEKLPPLNAIKFQIAQLFSNLISNAIKFKHPDRKCEISIKSIDIDKKEYDLFQLEKNKKYTKIIFSDNGIGFDSSFNERIFQLFQRLHKQKDYSGTGIGLSICKKIVEKHKGHIQAFGEIDKGVTFEIILPLNKNFHQ